MNTQMKNVVTETVPATNVAAPEGLMRAKYHTFDPPITADAVPTGGLGIHPGGSATFCRSWYLGIIMEGLHVFRGRPMDDERIIMTPAGQQHASELDEELARLLDSFFFVFVDEHRTHKSYVMLDEDQNHP